MRILVFALEKNPLSLGTSVLVDTEFRLGQLAQKVVYVGSGHSFFF